MSEHDQLSSSNTQSRAQRIVAGLGGRWFGTYGTACCPSHADTRPSLSIRGGRSQVLVKCHAGCESIDIISALQAKGLWPTSDRLLRHSPNRHPPSHPPSAFNASKFALELWKTSIPISGTLADQYLKHRGCTLSNNTDLRFLARAKHGPTQTYWPCLIAAVRDSDGAVVGVHRTFLDPSGPGKAPLDAPRLWLGPCRSHAIQLAAPVCGVLGLAEGLETADSAMQLFRVPSWSALAANNLNQVALPKQVKTLIIFGDNGAPGHAAAAKAAFVYRSRGLDVTIKFPPPQFDDFNTQVQWLAKQRKAGKQRPNGLLKEKEPQP